MSYFQALRFPFVLVTIVNTIVIWKVLKLPYSGTFFLVLSGLALVHLAANLWNDYHDQRVDSMNQSPTPFSGGSRVLQEKKMSPRALFLYAVAVSISALVIAIILIYSAGISWRLSLIILVSGFLTYFYTAPPLRLVYHGLGEPVIFLTFGPLIMIGIAFLMKVDINYTAFWVSCLMGYLTAQILFVNEFPDYEADRKAGKKNWVVLLGGPKNARWGGLFTVLLAIAGYLFTPLSFWPMLILAASGLSVVFVKNPMARGGMAQLFLLGVGLNFLMS